MPGAVPSAAKACPGCGRHAGGTACGFCGVAVAPGGFTVERVIKQGPHGRVYLARDAQGAAVALKELQFAAVPGAQEIDAFQREAEVLKTLRHPAIPRFVSSFQQGEGAFLRLYLASEFIDGESLATRLAERGRLPEDELLRLLTEGLHILQYLHGLPHPVLHRDLKPDNILLRPAGDVVLVDFGSARRLSGSRTHGATLAGTFGYMPIEQLGGSVDATSDLYALGATLLHAATGWAPDALMDDDFRLRVPLAVPERVRHVIAGMVQPRRDRRFPSAAAALAALRAGPKPRHRFGRAVAVGLGAGILVVGAARVATPSSDPAAPPMPAARPRVPGGPQSPSHWFQMAKPSCNSLEVAHLMARMPPMPGTDGAGFAATCYALAGRIDDARRTIAALPAAERPRATGVLFGLADVVADAGDDVAAAPMMNLILEFSPDHVQAMYHAGLSEYALGRPKAAAPLLERFLTLYLSEDGFRRNAVTALERIARGLPPINGPRH